jgi:hypothetical protein
MSYTLYTLYLILILIIILIIYIFSKKRDNFENIIFMEPELIYNELKQNEYILKLNKVNLIARYYPNDYNPNDYINYYKDNLLEFSENEKNKIKKIILKCDNKIKKYNSLFNIQWKICKISNKIENGFPHTLNDIIFVSSIPDIKTLIHEKIHIYQRYNKEKTEELYNKYGFSKVNKIKDELRRYNPDLDNYDYKYNNTIFYAKFNSNNPKNLLDYKIELLGNEISLLYFNEHPNEIFAYMISDYIYNNKKLDKDIIDYLL